MLEKYARHKKKQSETRTVSGIEAISSVTEYIGNMPLLIPIIERLEIRDIVDGVCPKERDSDEHLTHGEVLEMTVYNRLTSPRPLYRVEDWGRQYATETLFGIKPEKLNDDRIARMLETIGVHQEEIQSALSMRMMESFGISAKSIHYDITSLSFEGEYLESDVVRFGYSRDRRPDLKQVNVSLDVTTEGSVPVWSRTLPGNTTDVTTVMENMKSLKKNLQLKDYLVIMDRGMVSGDNLDMLLGQGIGFVAAVPLSENMVDKIRSTPDDAFEPIAYTDRLEKDHLRAARCPLEFHTKEGKPVPAHGWIFASSQKKKRDGRSLEKGIREITEILEDVGKKLNTRKYAKRDYVIAQLQKRIGKKHARGLFWWDLSGDDGELELDYCLEEEACRKAEELEGKYLLATSKPEWTGDEVISAYKSQHVVEWRFRHLKSRLKVSPLFLEKDERIVGLVFMTIVSLMVYSLLEFLCDTARVPLTAFMLMETFGPCGFSRIRFANNECLVLANDLTAFQEWVLGSLGFPHPREYL